MGNGGGMVIRMVFLKVNEWMIADTCSMSTVNWNFSMPSVFNADA
jgi:hypothetical protein